MKQNQKDHFSDKNLIIENEISASINNPRALEKLYRTDNSGFAKAFNTIFKLYESDPIAQTWNERLNFKHEESTWGNRQELMFVLIASLIAGIIAKLPLIAGLNEELFYSRNIGFLVFPFLTAYFAWKKQIQSQKMIFSLGIILVLVTYINLLPNNSSSDSIILSCIHLPMVLWGVLGFTFMEGDFPNLKKRIDFLRYNGDFLVMTALIVISGALFSAITINLFLLIQLDIVNFYTEYITVFGAVAAPLVSTYLVQNNPQLVSRISPIIARIFTPIVSLMLFIFLFAVILKGKYPTNDRNALMIFNGLLVGVMALILFSITEVSKASNRKANTLILLFLSGLTIIINGIALASIIFRINEYGMTPNRIAVLGANILIMIHILLVFKRLFDTTRSKSNMQEVENGIAVFLPFYMAWSAFVTLFFPLVFGFK